MRETMTNRANFHCLFKTVTSTWVAPKLREEDYLLWHHCHIFCMSICLPFVRGTHCAAVADLDSCSPGWLQTQSFPVSASQALRLQMSPFHHVCMTNQWFWTCAYPDLRMSSPYSTCAARTLEREPNDLLWELAFQITSTDNTDCSDLLILYSLLHEAFLSLKPCTALQITIEKDSDPLFVLFPGCPCF